MFPSRGNLGGEFSKDFFKDSSKTKMQNDIFTLSKILKFGALLGRTKNPSIFAGFFFYLSTFFFALHSQASRIETWFATLQEFGQSSFGEKCTHK